MKTCGTCQKPAKPLRKGECGACNRYRRQHGVARPAHFFNRAARCSVTDCSGLPGSLSGLCRKHYSRLQRHGDPEVTLRTVERHGHTRNREISPTYRVWSSIRNRCLSPTSDNYADYGGRGITVCERWNLFSSFLADMGPRPSETHSIDRFPDNDGNYEPGNCRWATPEQQQNNKRSNRLLPLNGQTLTVAQWCRKLGMHTSTLLNRLSRMSIHDALTTPVNSKKSRREPVC